MTITKSKADFLENFSVCSFCSFICQSNLCSLRVKLPHATTSLTTQR